MLRYAFLLLIFYSCTALSAQTCSITSQNANQDLCTACSTGTNPAIVNGVFTGYLDILVPYTIDADCLSGLVWADFVNIWVDRGGSLTFAQDPDVARATTVSATYRHHKHSGAIYAYGQNWYPRGQGDGYNDFAARMQASADRTIEPVPGGDASALPVSLLHYRATRSGTTVSLEWATAREESTDRFELQHSTDGKTFVLLTGIPAAGKSDTTRQYRATHTAGFADRTHYYRLVQYDYDGSRAVLGIRAVRAAGAYSPGSIYPNPAAAGQTVTLSLTASAQLVTLYDLRGQVISTYPVAPIPTLRTVIALPRDLSQGTYYLRHADKTTKLVVR